MEARREKSGGRDKAPRREAKSLHRGASPGASRRGWRRQRLRPYRHRLFHAAWGPGLLPFRAIGRKSLNGFHAIGLPVLHVFRRSKVIAFALALAACGLSSKAQMTD